MLQFQAALHNCQCRPKRRAPLWHLLVHSKLGSDRTHTVPTRRGSSNKAAVHRCGVCCKADAVVSFDEDHANSKESIRRLRADILLATGFVYR